MEKFVEQTLLYDFYGELLTERQQQVYESVWKEPYLYASNSTIMVHIRNLRIKIENVPESPEHIKTVWGKGYRFE